MVGNLNMQIYVVVDEVTYNDLITHGFSRNLGYWFWNIAVMIAPYDTGNLRSSIYLAQNKARHIKITYDFLKANYGMFLEEGIGPVKKYKDFIKVDTTMAITEQLVGWLKTQQKLLYVPVMPKPFVELRASRHQPFSAERALLRQADMNANAITAKSRSVISKIREIDRYGMMRSSSGLKPRTENAPGMKSQNRGISKLHEIYRERIGSLKGS